MQLWKTITRVAIFPALFLTAAAAQAVETETYTVRDTGFVRHNVLDFLATSQPVSVGYVSGGAGGTYRGYLDFLCDPPFFTEHPGANILSVTLKLNVKVANPQIASAEYKVVNLESLLNPAAGDAVEEIDTNNTAAEIYNATGSGTTMATFSNFTQVPLGALVTIPLDKNTIDLGAKTKNYFIGLREEGDNNGLVVFNGSSDAPLAELVITYDFNSSASSFSWPSFLPAIYAGGSCSSANLNGCGTESKCTAAGGAWDGSQCTTCPFTGSYSGTWSERSCDLLPYQGGWTGTVDQHCHFTGYDDNDDDFLQGSIHPSSGQATSLTGTEEDCGPITGTGLFTNTGVTGTYKGSGVSGSYTGTKQ